MTLPKLYPEVFQARFVAGTKEAVYPSLRPGESFADYLRTALAAERRRRTAEAEMPGFAGDLLAAAAATQANAEHLLPGHVGERLSRQAALMRIAAMVLGAGEGAGAGESAPAPAEPTGADEIAAGDAAAARPLTGR